MNPKLFNPDYLLSLCQKYGLRPSKKYGQNFLLSPEVIEEMIAAAEVGKKDTVVEVGPGFGVLTFALAEKAGKVLAFEIEKRLEEYWKKSAPGNLEIIWGNVLKEFEKVVIARTRLGGDEAIFLIGDCRVPKGARDDSYKVVANLPYQITSNVIRTFLESENPPGVMVLMAQKEVAERICARPGEMSLLSVAVQYYASAEIIAQVPRHLFWPEPAVDSAVIRIIPHASVIARSPDLVGTTKQSPGDRHGLRPRDDMFFKIVKAGFAQKRKKLSKNIPQAKSFFKELGIGEQARAQELSLEQWKELVIHLSV